MATLLLLTVTLFFPFVLGATSYDNDFVNPDLIVGKQFESRFAGAQETVIQWAEELAAQGPWSVMNKTVVAPSGDKHDYLSWAPYSWPNCTGVGNTTELTPEQVWTTCPYYTRDGEFNPDRLLVNDTGHFGALADTVFYNSLAWAIKNDSTYSKTVASFMQTWFLDSDTKMNPNLNYAQMARGPNGQVGQHTGVLDLKAFAKIASGILILRKGQSPEWTTQVDQGIVDWATQYINWLETNPIALGEAHADNNHGSYYYNQLAALKLIVNDVTGATNVTNTYFSGIYLGQVEANGEQPLEAARTRPFHYRCYNLNAMITNARLAEYANPSSKPWNTTTKAGGTIKAALDFTLTVNPTGDEVGDGYELWPAIAAIASTYGDPDGNYLQRLQKERPEYAVDPYFLWAQPLSGSASANDSDSDNGSSGSAAGSSSNGKTSRATHLISANFWTLASISLVVVLYGL